jgi:DNA-3-methyladenine glycosylase II
VRQAARIVSLDYDGDEFVAVGARDPVIAELQRRHHGQRPVLFHSPYEAAAWSIISARRPARQAAQVRTAIAQAHGETFEDLAGQTLHAFPQPDRLAQLPDDTPGLSTQKIERLRELAGPRSTGASTSSTSSSSGPSARPSTPKS